MQFSSLSTADINNLRAKFGLPPLGAEEGEAVREGMLSSGQMSSEQVLAAPGTSAYNQQVAEDPEWVAQQEAERDAARAAVINQAPAEAENPPPAGVSQWLWDRVTSGTMGINPTLITRDPAVRDALIDAGYTDYVKAMYEQHMDNNAAHAIGNGADPSAAWGNANNSIGNDWYQTNYGTYSNNTVAGSTGSSGAGDFTFGGGTTPEGTEEQPYVPPQPPVVDDSVGDPNESGGGQQGGGSEQGGGDSTGDTGGGPWGGGANVGQAPGGSQSSGYGPGIHNYNATAVSDGPMVNTGIGAASQNAATPWADAYMRASERSQAKGPISGLFAKELEK